MNKPSTIDVKPAIKISLSTPTSITIYLLFVFLFIISMYCLFNKNVRDPQTKHHLENMGYILLFFFEFILFAFILWKFYKAYFGKEDDFIKEKGFEMVEYMAKLTGNSEPFGSYSTAIFYIVMFITFFYFCESIITMSVEKSSQNMDSKIAFFFSILAMGGLATILYRSIRIPLAIVLLVSIVFNIISTIFVLISFSNIPKNEQKESVPLPDYSVESLRIYKILTVTCICILFVLALILFTRNMKLTAPGVNVKSDSGEMITYLGVNGIVILFSFGITLISTYNVYNADKLMFGVYQWAKSRT
jgi:hypothetical protein